VADSRKTHFALMPHIRQISPNHSMTAFERAFPPSLHQTQPNGLVAHGVRVVAQNDELQDAGLTKTRRRFHQTILTKVSDNVSVGVSEKGSRLNSVEEDDTRGFGVGGLRCDADVTVSVSENGWTLLLRVIHVVQQRVIILIFILFLLHVVVVRINMMHLL